jgi:hypothetical protein
MIEKIDMNETSKAATSILACELRHAVGPVKTTG